MVKQFSDLEAARLFTVELYPEVDPQMVGVGCDRYIPHEEGSRMKYVEAPYVFNDIKVPLWTIRKRKLKRGERKAQQVGDHLREGISTHPPGSRGRIADLAAHYSEVAADPSAEVESAFDI